MDVIPSDLATYGSEAKKLLGFAEPETSGLEHSGQSPSARQQHLSGRLYCPEV